MKPQHTDAADERGKVGGLVVGATPLIAGGLALFILAVDNVAKFTGAMLTVLGLTLAAAALWILTSGPARG